MVLEVKKPLRAQSKYGLMGSSATTRKFFIGGSQEHFLGQKHKSAIWDRTLPYLQSNLVYMCAGGFRVPNLQTELNYLDSFKSYCNSSDLGFLSLWGWGEGQMGGGIWVE